ncbi:hypothetical protein [Variovorax sp. GT1P44]|uniref:hypothetical protein n=1 Tax=Variovorax sp. GT1P44 TaxID=3443742 RepID=UPI003F449D64
MARPNEWVNKVLALLRAGNTTAAIAQIKVAPSAKDVRALQSALEAGNLSEPHRLSRRPIGLSPTGMV